MTRVSQQLLKINGTAVANPKEYSVEYNKLWSNAGRNLAGRMSATLVGLYPKIKVKPAIQEKDVFARMAQLLQLPQFNVEYYDFMSQTTRTGIFYASDFDIKLKERDRGLIEEVSFSLVPYDKY